MRILIDALSARQQGGQTYLKNLLAFVPFDGSVDVLLLAPQSLKLEFDHPHVERRSVPKLLENPFARVAWERLVLARVAREFRADILFCPGGVVTAAPAGCKVVTMFRNMIPFDARQRARYPFGYERFRNWLLHRLMLRSMLRADLVIFISNYARQVVERFAAGRRIRSVVIPHGVAPQFRAPAIASDNWAAGHFGASYFLYVSYIDFYKAQIEVVQAFASFKQQSGSDFKLLIVGPENPDYGRKVRAEIHRLGLTRDVVITGALPYGDLPGLYQHATLNIFASESENCPNILLEAMAAGRPVLSSNRPPMPEFAGDGAIYFDPATPAELAGRLCSLIDDPTAIAELGRRAQKRSELYDWQTTAGRTWDAIKQLVNGGRIDGAR
ncbi:MAG: glycosyltransferase family 1 protein [Gemmatimonadota bacterium]